MDRLVGRNTVVVLYNNKLVFTMRYVDTNYGCKIYNNTSHYAILHCLVAYVTILII